MIWRVIPLAPALIMLVGISFIALGTLGISGALLLGARQLGLIEPLVPATDEPHDGSPTRLCGPIRRMREPVH